SVVGWVEAANRAPLSPKCRVELVPRGAPARPAPGERSGKPTREAEVNARGFFHVDGIAPGSYTAVARQPGYAPARQVPLTVYAGTGLELRRPLVRAPPASLEVTLDPPHDPWDQPWRIELASTLELTQQIEPVASATVGDDGVWKQKGLAPGT